VAVGTAVPLDVGASAGSRRRHRMLSNSSGFLHTTAMQNLPLLAATSVEHRGA